MSVFFFCFGKCLVLAARARYISVQMAAYKRFFRFNRPERYGVLVLGMVILVLLMIRLAIPVFVHPPRPDIRQLAQLNHAYERWLQTQAATAPENGFWRSRNEPAVEMVLAPFDPNTVDSMGIRRLGLPGYVARSWINWRDRYGKVFYSADEVREIRALKLEDFERIRPYIRISAVRPAFKPYGSRFETYIPPAFVDIATADTTLLDRAIPGVGPYIARRIIEKRDALGGYLNIEQVLEGLRIPDSTAQNLRQKLRIVPDKIRKLSLNKASFEQLKRHPYIGEKMAKNILDFREALGGYQDVSQLKQVPLMNGDSYRKLAAYFEL